MARRGHRRQGDGDKDPALTLSSLTLIPAKKPSSVARPVAVLLTIGALSLGVSACGSSSSAGSHKSTSSGVKKEAGLLDVQLTVYNMTGNSLKVELCGAKSCTIYPAMENGKSVTEVSGGGYHKPDGQLKYPGGSTVYFHSANPLVGEPFVNVSTNVVSNDPNLYLAEGESKTIIVGGDHFYVDREPDTDYKVMRLIACPTEAPSSGTIAYHAGCR